MGRPIYLCPVHDYERNRCSWYCAIKRRELSLLARDYRQYWYDRKRGIPARTYPRREALLRYLARI